MTDIVHEVLERLKNKIASAYGLPDEVAEIFGLVEREVKNDFGGDRLTVERWVDREKADRVRRDYLANVDEREITGRHGISRATMYRYLKRDG